MNVLDHGFITLHSTTRRVVEPDGWTGDLEVISAARTSYAGEDTWREDRSLDEKLLKYLLKNRHTSPFEMMDFTFHVKCPLFVARQWHRHRTWSYSEVSARYTELPEEYYIPNVQHVGVQSATNKQMRLFDSHQVNDIDRQFIEELQVHSALGFQRYQYFAERGIPRELARLFLGLNTYTHFYAKVDLHNLLHFLTLRLHEHSQYEIRVYANTILWLIEPYVPLTVKYFKAEVLA